MNATVGFDTVYPLHTPALHCAGAGHPASQAPQFFGSVWTLVHVPQVLCPVGQHIDWVHVCEPGQGVPQLPQWSSDCVRSKHPGVPLSALHCTMGPPPSTTPASVGHVKTHSDWMHVAVACTVPATGGRHCAPHVPQFWLSLVRSKQPATPGHVTMGSVQGAWHCEAWQMSPVGHMWPQLPQFSQSVAVLAPQLLPPLLLPLLLPDELPLPLLLPDSADASSPVAAGVPPVAQARNDATAAPPARIRVENSVTVRDG
jgi:hypothetical protein